MRSLIYITLPFFLSFFSYGQESATEIKTIDEVIEGIDELLLMIEERLNKSMAISEYHITHNRYDLIAKLRNQGSICVEEIVNTGVKISASPRGGLEELLSEFKVI